MATTKPAGELVSIRLADIEIRDGANPRTEIDSVPLRELAKSIGARGVETPVHVRHNDDDAELPYLLIAGERRCRAARMAGHDRVDAILKPQKPGSSDLAKALLENTGREGLNPVDEAVAYSRLLDEERKTGGTRRGLAEFLGVAQKRVTERLQILELPEQMHEHLASGAIPLGALSGLRALSSASPDVAVFVAEFLVHQKSTTPFSDRSWSDFIASPNNVAWVSFGDPGVEKPADVFRSYERYPLSAFTLSEKAEKNLANLQTLWGASACQEIAFGTQAVDTAQALRSAIVAGDDRRALILGQDVADELAADVIAHCLKRARAERRHANARAEADVAGDAPSGGDSEQARKHDERRKHHEEEMERLERRRQAVAHNHELGAKVVEAFGRLKPDMNVIKILATIAFGDLLGCLAMRGARYGYPGWYDITAAGEPATTAYLDYAACVEKLQGQLAHVKAPTELAGRLVGLVVMARFANEEDAVDYREQARWEVEFGDELGWSDELIDVIDTLAAERLPAHLVESTLAERASQVRARNEHEQRVTSIRARLDQSGDLTVADCKALREEIAAAFTSWSSEHRELSATLTAIEKQLEAGQVTEAVAA